MKRKIVYCIPSLHIHGGMERVVTNKANFFAEQLGYDVYIIMTDAKEKKPFFKLSSKVQLIQLDEDFEELWCQPLWKKCYLYIKHLHGYRKKLTKYLMELKPDITISTLRREINFICDIKDGSKKIGEMHMNRKEFRNLNQEKSLGIVKKVIQYMWNKQLLRSLKKLDKFIVLTERDKAEWVELNNVQAIPNPLSFYSETPSGCNNKSTIAVGRFCYQKGFDLLVQAWKEVAKKHPDWKLNIYGDNGEKITQYVKTMNMEESCILHPVTYDIENKMTENSIFILSSRFEGFGMVISEAMACGLPAVAFDCHFGPREIIHDKTDGLLAKSGDIHDLAEKICFLIEHEDERKEMGRKAYYNIKRLHISQIGMVWDNLFNTLLNNK